MQERNRETLFYCRVENTINNPFKMANGDIAVTETLLTMTYRQPNM